MRVQRGEWPSNGQNEPLLFNKTRTEQEFGKLRRPWGQHFMSNSIKLGVTFYMYTIE